MNTIQRRHLSRPVELRADVDKPRQLAGLAAVFFNAADPGTEFVLMRERDYEVVERIMPGAFDDCMAQDVRCLYDHESDQLLGRTKSGTMRLALVAAGLRYEVDLPDTALARDLSALIARGDITGSSFAFSLADGGAHWLTEGNREIRVITRVEALHDVGPVTYPAYEAATTGLRSADGLDEIRASLAKHRAARPDADHEQRKRQAHAAALAVRLK
jgi:HK97 family phage prohead protease